MKRTEARQQAMCSLYEFEVQRDTAPEQLILQSKEQQSEPAPYAKKVYLTAVAHLGEIDELIATSADNWSFSRIGKVSLAILRVAVTELCFLDEPISPEIAVNEALELARTYDTEKAIPFINGVLAKVITTRVKP